MAIICSCMPACASFSKHMFKHSNFLISLRSAFGSSNNRGGKGSGGLKTFPAPSSSGSENAHWQSLPDNSYVELQKSNGSGWSAQAGQQYPPLPGAANQQKPEGIHKSVAVNVVSTWDQSGRVPV